MVRQILQLVHKEYTEHDWWIQSNITKLLVLYRRVLLKYEVSA